MIVGCSSLIYSTAGESAAVGRYTFRMNKPRPLYPGPPLMMLPEDAVRPGAAGPKTSKAGDLLGSARRLPDGGYDLAGDGR
jgi:hypothetical protein